MVTGQSLLHQNFRLTGNHKVRKYVQTDYFGITGGFRVSTGVILSLQGVQLQGKPEVIKPPGPPHLKIPKYKLFFAVSLGV